MSVISGENITLNALDIFNIQSGIVIRNITASSNDTLDTANNFAQLYMGGFDPANDGSSFSFIIYNTNATNSITLFPGTGMTINPLNSLANDTIPPNHSRRYHFVQTSAVMGVSAEIAIYPLT